VEFERLHRGRRLAGHLTARQEQQVFRWTNPMIPVGAD
jgi:hypothetical protein